MGSELPFLSINMAMTVDGKIATANRRISSFSSAEDRQQLLLLRSRADAVMAGARTVDLNRITLGPGSARYRRARLRNGLAEYNLRIIVSGSGTINPKADIFRHRFSPILILTTTKAGSTSLRRLRDVADEVKVFDSSSIDFVHALRWLRKEWGVKRLLSEGGGELNDALFAAGVVDELNLTVCPKLLGGQGAPTIADGVGAPVLAQATRLRMKDFRRAGDELFLVYDVLQPSGPNRASTPRRRRDRC